jgi:hypothetical protein
MDFLPVAERYENRAPLAGTSAAITRVATVLFCIAATAGCAAPVNSRSAPRSPAAATRTTQAQAGPAGTTPPTLLPPPGASETRQTTQQPSDSTPVFGAEMTALWNAIVAGDPALASDVFFPESAYVQLKALSNDSSDYQNRLLGHFRLDVLAAHELVAGGGPAQFSRVVVPPNAAWIGPAQCYNRLGYWHVPGARLVYSQGGATRSLGIASMISWRGYWYVVHLGSVTPPAGQGVVDAPASGVGPFVPTGGC